MSTTKYPNHVRQTTGGHYREFNHISYIKNTDDDYYAECNTIMGKSKTLNRPSVLTLENYKFGLPTGARVTQIKVTYRHSKTGKCNIGAPDIVVMNGEHALRYNTAKTIVTKKGQAPTDNPKTETVTFKSSWNWNIFNSNTFGVRLGYPANSSEGEGTVRVYFFRVELTYYNPLYGVTMKKVVGGYNHEDYTVSLTLTNKNRVNYNPTVLLTAPAGFSLKTYKGRGKLTNGPQQRSWYWSPGVSGRTSSVLNVTLVPDVSYGSGQSSYTGTFGLSYTVDESNTGYTSHTATIRDRPKTAEEQSETEPVYEDSTEDPVIEITTITQDKEFEYTLTIDDATWDDIIQDIYDEGIRYEWWEGSLEDNLPTILNEFRVLFCEGAGETYLSRYHKLTHSDSASAIGVLLKDFVNHQTTISHLKGTSIGYDEIYMRVRRDGYEFVTFRVLNIVWKFDIKPATLTTPNLSILKPSEEETLRLGHGYSYTLQSYIKQTTTEEYVRNWDKNFRIGVFNNPIKNNITTYTTTDPETGETIEHIIDSTDYNNLSTEDIFNNAEYWSGHLNNVNTLENIECDFVYNKNYPIYIIITGDYPEGSQAGNTIKYTEPCIVEKTRYHGYEPNGLYPISIDDIVADDTVAEVNIPSLQTTAPVVCYQLPLDQDYGTNTEIAIRGLELTGNIEKSDEMVLYAKLVNAQQESRERSVVLSDYDTNVDGSNNFSIGGIGDLWGFSTLDIVNLEDWEIELTASNVLNEQLSSLNIGSVQFNIYIEQIAPTNTKCLINGEDLSYYGVFLTDVNVPEGLETNTKFLQVDGTDTNTAYQQNIKEKTITVEFDIGDCDLTSSTNSLRELTRLLTNKRNKYNQPIPNTIEFEHYPDVYWEYIMESPLDTELEVSTYKVKAKLTVPSGTAYDKNSTTTNNTGYVSGLAPVNPVITFKPTTDTISITEEISGQKFNMGYNGDWQNGIVEIDCDNRTVTLKTDEDDDTGTDLTPYVDFNSAWFVLYEEYEFTTVNCLIRTITYNERW